MSTDSRVGIGLSFDLTKSKWPCNMPALLGSRLGPQYWRIFHFLNTVQHAHLNNRFLFWWFMNHLTTPRKHLTSFGLRITTLSKNQCHITFLHLCTNVHYTITPTFNRNCNVYYFFWHHALLLLGQLLLPITLTYNRIRGNPLVHHKNRKDGFP